jgi:hypothetical protein
MLVRVVDKMMRDNSAQMEVLESILMMGMIFVTLFFAQNLDTAFYETIGEKSIITNDAETALNSLDNDPDFEYSSKLVRYIEQGDNISFHSFFYERIFPALNYKVYIYNISQMFINSTFNDYDIEIRQLWYDAGRPSVGEKEQAHWFYVNNSYLYELVVEMWYI